MKTKKKTTKKVVKKVTKKEVLVTDPQFLVNNPTIDWTKVKTGTYFKGKIAGNSSEGLILVEGDILYFCQNTRDLDGGEGNTKLGFKNSWRVDLDETEHHLNGMILLATPPKSFKVPERPFMAGEYEVTFRKGSIEVGCTRVSNDVVREIAKKLID